MYEAYYDSDDDVCWGPYSLREFKRDVLKQRNKEDIASRSSVGCDPRFINDVEKRGASLIAEQVVPSSPSASVMDHNFIEKISQILNQDSKQEISTDIITLSDLSTSCSESSPKHYNLNNIITRGNDDTFDEYCSDNREESVAISLCDLKIDDFDKCDTQKNSKSYSNANEMLKYLHVCHEESPVKRSYGLNNFTTHKNEEIFYEFDMHTTVESLQSPKNQTISLSDSASESCGESFTTPDENEMLKPILTSLHTGNQTYSSSKNTDTYYSARSQIDNVINSAREGATHNDTSFMVSSLFSETDNKKSSAFSDVDVLSINSNQSYINSKLGDNMEDNKADVSDIDVYSYSDAETSISTCDSSSSKRKILKDFGNETPEMSTDVSEANFKFDDTLEDMERLLLEGEDYLMNDKISCNNEEATKRCETGQNLAASGIPVLCRFNRILSTPTATKTRSPVAEFKIPKTPIIIRDRFKNIKSPVAHYIKNTPTVPLYKKITPKKCNKEILEKATVSSLKQNKENIETEFPEVVYRKAAHTVTNTQSSFKLPNNIESLLPSRNYIVRHVERIGGIKNDCVGRRLLEDDLSVNITSNDSLLNCSLQNVSIHVSKRTNI